ncbi:MAG: hypothetical protein J6V07_04065 [Clostridia bacterium]|nr:hypothetical protein [Clostridia bacterium]
MERLIEIDGGMEIPHDVTVDDFVEAFLAFVEERGWRFGGGFREIVDGYYVQPDGTRVGPVE